jgi:hypothetical protein
MYESDQKVEKHRVEVEVELDNGTRMLGALFIKQMQRISDLLNDQRQFLPFETSDGRILHLNKSTIAKAVQLVREAELSVATDPYEILGVPRNISNEDLRDAYHSLCSQNHPDKLQSLGVSPDLIDIANSRVIRIIDAYKRIQTLRQDVNAAGGNGTSPFSTVN